MLCSCIDLVDVVVAAAAATALVYCNYVIASFVFVDLCYFFNVPFVRIVIILLTSLTGVVFYSYDLSFITSIQYYYSSIRRVLLL